MLHKAVPTIIAYSHEIPVTFLCDKVQQECWLNKCASCLDGRGFQRRYKLGEDDNKPVTWYVWKQTESEQLTKVVEDGTTADLLNMLRHYYHSSKNTALSKEHSLSNTKLKEII